MEKKMKKEYQSAPLPFMGQKRMYRTMNYNSAYTDIMLYKSKKK